MSELAYKVKSSVSFGSAGTASQIYLYGDHDGFDAGFDKLLRHLRNPGDAEWVELSISAMDMEIDAGHRLINAMADCPVPIVTIADGGVSGIAAFAWLMGGKCLCGVMGYVDIDAGVLALKLKDHPGEEAALQAEQNSLRLLIKNCASRTLSAEGVKVLLRGGQMLVGYVPISKIDVKVASTEVDEDSADEEPAVFH